MIDSLVNIIKEKAAKSEHEIIELRHELHTCPEIGFELPNTVKIVSETLRKYGAKIKQCGRSGITSELGQGAKTIILRADMDALKMKEESVCKFTSKNGNMHACGHDIHTAMLLGAFMILRDFQDIINGRIIFCFQPAEEILQGARSMIEHGLLDGGIDIAIMIHVILGTNFKTGFTIVSSEGITAPSSDFFEIIINGKSSHGATPYDAANALSTAARIVLSIEELPAKEFTIAEDVTVSVCTFNSGVAPNVISDKSIIKGTIRAYSELAREKLLKRIKELSCGICALYGCNSEFNILSSAPPLVNDGLASTFIFECAKNLFGESNCTTSNKLGGRGGGSEDFAYIAKRVPSVMIAMSAGAVKDGYRFPLHNPKATFDDAVIRAGSELMAYSALKYLRDTT